MFMILDNQVKEKGTFFVESSYACQSSKTHEYVGIGHRKKQNRGNMCSIPERTE